MRLGRLRVGERLLERRARVLPARGLERLPTVEEPVDDTRCGHAATLANHRAPDPVGLAVLRRPVCPHGRAPRQRFAPDAPAPITLGVCRRSRSSPSGWPARGWPPATRRASPRRRRAPPRTSRATPRCSPWRRGCEGLTRERYDEAVDRGDLVVAHVVRGAIHALAPGDLALYGRALISRDDDELTQQLGEQVRRLAAEKGFAPTDALAEVAEATKDALSGGRALSKVELHEELRERVGDDLKPWCKGCQSHHVAPMLWRYATVKAGARLDSERRYVAGQARSQRRPPPRRSAASCTSTARPRAADFAEWTGVAKPHAERLWAEVEGDLDEVSVGKRRAWALRDDARGARLAAGGRGHPPDPTGRSLSAEAQPPAARRPRPSCASGCSGPWRAPARC